MDKNHQVKSYVVIYLRIEGGREREWKLWIRIYMNYILNQIGKLQGEHKVP